MEEKSKEIKDQYEKQITKLKNELKQLKTAKKEHQKAIKQQAATDRQLKSLKKDLEEMKKQRVKLMHKMREEAEKNRQQVREQCCVCPCLRVYLISVPLFVWHEGHHETR